DASHDDDDDDQNSSGDEGRGRPRERRTHLNILNSNLKLPQPETFVGNTTKVTNWLLQMELYFDAIEPSDQQRVKYAAMLLKDNALVWWMAMKQENTQPRSWSTFKR